MTSVVCQKYLDVRAVCGPWQVEGAPGRHYCGAVVIPALAEEQALPHTLAALAGNPPENLARFLVLVVVNNRIGAPAEVRADNQRTLERLRQGDPRWKGLSTAWVDAASPGYELPEKDGVGLARKIGFDLALRQLDWSAEPILVSLDADTLVQPDYLPALERHFSRSAPGGAVLSFAHQRGATPELDQAITLYELYLRHYVLGLELAGSPYAYHSIGSAFACRADAYVAAGGMNRRLGGEDFYFLQQLAKTCGVGRVCGTLVRPSPRISARTPFGTGPAVAALQAGQKSSALFYPPQAFEVLSQWLRLVDEQIEAPGTDLHAAAVSLSPLLGDFLLRSGFEKAWTGLCRQHAASSSRLRRAFHQWFDGLKTRQLVYALSEAGGCGTGPRWCCRSCWRAPDWKVMAALALILLS
jgi:hypothetical protein